MPDLAQAQDKGPDPLHPIPASPRASWDRGYGVGVVTSHMRLLFLHRSTCSGEMTLPVNGPISVPALIQVLEKMPSPSPGMELWAMITSDGSTRLDNFCTSVGDGEGSEKGPAAFLPTPWGKGRGAGAEG